MPTLATLRAHCSKTYGADLLSVDPTCALWVAEAFGGWEAWVRVSRARNKVGKGTMFPAYGSACLPARSA